MNNEGTTYKRSVAEAALEHHHVTFATPEPWQVGEILFHRGRPKWRVVTVNDTCTIRLEKLHWFERFTYREVWLVWGVMFASWVYACMQLSP